MKSLDRLLPCGSSDGGSAPDEGANPPCRGPTGGSDAAVSEIVGSLLLVGLTVTISAALVVYILAAHPGPQEELAADFGLSACEDDTVTIEHLGGETLAESDIEVIVTVVDETSRYELADVYDPPDGFEIGETATIDEDTPTTGGDPLATIESGDTVYVSIVESGEYAIYRGTTTASGGSC